VRYEPPQPPHGGVFLKRVGATRLRGSMEVMIAVSDGIPALAMKKGRRILYSL